METVGIIGLGTMGRPIARHLVDSEWCRIVYDSREEAMAPFVDDDITLAGSASEVAASADVLLLLLPDSTVVESVVLGDGSDGISADLTEGNVVIDMGTSAPASTARIARHLEDRGVKTLGAPISGGEVSADEGTLTVMAGGAESVVTRCRPMFDAFANVVVQVGPQPRDGHIVKLLNNFLSFSAFLLTSEAVSIAEEADIATERMYEVLNSSTGVNSATQYKFPEYVETGSYDSGAPISTLKKDLEAYTEFAGEDASLLFGDFVSELVTEGALDLGPDTDHTYLFEYVRDRIYDGSDSG